MEVSALSEYIFNVLANDLFWEAIIAVLVLLFGASGALAGKKMRDLYKIIKSLTTSIQQVQTEVNAGTSNGMDLKSIVKNNIDDNLEPTLKKLVKKFNAHAFK
tara:strand:- start:117 stop:425 length:309 start_codon:yes stop_codon:yes gene_type:complete